MKKLLYLLLILPLFVACDKDEDNTPTQDHTSFVVTNTSSVDLPNTVVGYKLADGTYKKIAELGDLKKGVPSKEVRLTDNTISEIYFFTDYNGVVRVNKTFNLTKNIKNVLELPSGISGISASPKTDATKYPQ